MIIIVLHVMIIMDRRGCLVMADGEVLFARSDPRCRVQNAARRCPRHLAVVFSQHGCCHCVGPLLYQPQPKRGLQTIEPVHAAPVHLEPPNAAAAAARVCLQSTIASLCQDHSSRSSHRRPRVDRLPLDSRQQRIEWLDVDFVAWRLGR